MIPRIKERKTAFEKYTDEMKAFRTSHPNIVVYLNYNCLKPYRILPKVQYLLCVLPEAQKVLSIGGISMIV